MLTYVLRLKVTSKFTTYKKIILQRCDCIWSGHQYLKLASLSSSSKTECKTTHLSEFWGQPNSVTAISAYKRKETKKIRVRSYF